MIQECKIFPLKIITICIRFKSKEEDTRLSGENQISSYMFKCIFGEMMLSLYCELDSVCTTTKHFISRIVDFVKR